MRVAGGALTQYFQPFLASSCLTFFHADWTGNRHNGRRRGVWLMHLRRKRIRWRSLCTRWVRASWCSRCYTWKSRVATPQQSFCSQRTRRSSVALKPSHPGRSMLFYWDLPTYHPFVGSPDLGDAASHHEEHAWAVHCAGSLKPAFKWSRGNLFGNRGESGQVNCCFQSCFSLGARRKKAKVLFSLRRTFQPQSVEWNMLELGPY